MKFNSVIWPFLILLMIFSCTNFKSGRNIQAIEQELKESSAKFKDVNINPGGNVTMIFINENSYIFDSIYNGHKAQYVAYEYARNIDSIQNIALAIVFKNESTGIYERLFRKDSLISIIDFYNKNKEYRKAQRLIISSYKAEEQWNIKNALKSLTIERPEYFKKRNYFNYILDASQKKNGGCDKIRLIHALLREVKLENFWNKDGKRKDPTEFIEKSNKVLETLKCKKVKASDTFVDIQKSLAE